MSVDVSLKWAAVLATFLAAGTASAFVAPTQQAESITSVHAKVGIRVIRPRLVAGRTHAELAANGQASVRQDDRSGAARVITGTDLLGEEALTHGATAAAFEAQARRYIAAHAQALGVEAADLELNQASVLIDKDVQFLAFKVRRGGLDVQDGSVDFRFKRGKLVQVVNQTYAEAATDTRPVQDGLNRAVESALITRSVKATGERYRVTEGKKGYTLVRVAEFDATTQDGRRFIVQVEAATGKVFEIRPTEFMLDGSATGSVYPRWYGETAAVLPYRDLKLAYTGGTITTDADGRFAGAPATAQPGFDGFAGSRVKVVPETGAKVKVAGSQIRDGWEVVFTKGDAPASEDEAMAQSMTYYHLNKEINHAKQYISTPWFDQQLTANVNLAQTCNAYWDGSSVNLFSAGEGCANTALISDVFYHEWGHGLDDNTGGIEDGGYSEGFGDIMSLMMTHSNIIGQGFMVADGSPVRDLEEFKSYPADAGTEVHTEGQIIGGTFWDLFKNLRDAYGDEKAGDLLSTYALKSIFTAHKYTDVYDALLVIDDNDGDLTNGTPNLCLINKAFARHGLATAAESCNLASLDKFEIDDSRGNGNGFIEPGETVSIYATARNAAAASVSGMTGLLAINGVPGVAVVDGHLTWNEIPARSSTRSTEGATVTVDRGVACGTTLHTTVALSAGNRSGSLVADLLVGRLIGSAVTFSASGLPLPVHDNATATATTSVDGTGWAADTKVQAAHLKFDVLHTYVGDLTVKLVAPNGTSVPVWQGSGSGHDEHFDADITQALTGLAGKGTWKLLVTDDASQDEGSLQSFQLTVTPASFECR